MHIKLNTASTMRFVDEMPSSLQQMEGQGSKILIQSWGVWIDRQKESEKGMMEGRFQEKMDICVELGDDDRLYQFKSCLTNIPQLKTAENSAIRGPHHNYSSKTVIINHLRQASLGRGRLAFSLLSLPLFLRSRGSFSLSWSMIFKVDSFRSVSTEVLLTRSDSQLLLGSRSLSSLPIDPFLEGLMVQSSLFSLSLRSKLDQLNFSLGKRYSCFRMRLLWSSPSADGLSFADGAMHSLKNASRSCEYISGILSQMPASIFLRSAGRSAARKGGRIAAIQYSTHPNDQISHLAVQGRSPHTSGLEQQGVPVWVQARPLLLTFDTFISPNLAYLASPERRILALLTSLWKILSRWRALSPKSSWIAIFQISYQAMRSFFFWWSLMKLLRSPSLANSVTRTSDCSLSSQKASLQARTQGLVILARMRTQLRQQVTSFGLLFTNLIFFRAQKAPSCLRLALQTEANAPCPTLLTTSKLCIAVNKNYSQTSLATIIAMHNIQRCCPGPWTCFHHDPKECRTRYHHLSCTILT